MGARSFGARVQRVEDPRLITGSGRFTDDSAIPAACVIAAIKDALMPFAVSR